MYKCLSVGLVIVVLSGVSHEKPVDDVESHYHEDVEMEEGSTLRDPKNFRFKQYVF